MFLFSFNISVSTLGELPDAFLIIIRMFDKVLIHPEFLNESYIRQESTFTANNTFFGKLTSL